MGNRGDERPADAFCQDRGDGRPRALCDPGTAESELRGVGSRLRISGFAEDKYRPRENVELEGSEGAGFESSSLLLSSGLLVLSSAAPRER